MSLNKDDGKLKKQILHNLQQLSKWDLLHVRLYIQFLLVRRTFRNFHIWWVKFVLGKK